MLKQQAGGYLILCDGRRYGIVFSRRCGWSIRVTASTPFLAENSARDLGWRFWIARDLCPLCSAAYLADSVEQ